MFPSPTHRSSLLRDVPELRYDSNRMITEIDKQFLKRAMRLAMNGRGHTEPNPSVGCVLVKNGQTLGEGWTQAFGGAHAEPTALADCKAKGNDPAGATAYVTLEPCCHTNKKTPPCAPRLIEAKIARVVIGCLDPNPDVNGKGVVMLRQAGIEVDCLPGAKPSGPLAPVPGGEGQGEGERTGRVQVSSDTQVTTPSPRDQASPIAPSPPSTGERESNASHFQQLIAPFFAWREYTGSYITLKWAETADGKISGPNGQRLAITGPKSNRLVHTLRGRSDALIVGVNTVINDDPLLSVRDVASCRTPRRVVLDSRFRFPEKSKLLADAPTLPLTVFVGSNLIDNTDARAKAERLEAHGAEVNFQVDVDQHGRLQTIELLAFSSLKRVGHILIEPGAILAREFLPWAHRVWRFRSTNVFGGSDAVEAIRLPDTYIEVGRLQIGDDVLVEYLNTKPPDKAYFAPVPSADFVLAQEQAAGA